MIALCREEGLRTSLELPIQVGRLAGPDKSESAPLATVPRWGSVCGAEAMPTTPAVATAVQDPEELRMTATMEEEELRMTATMEAEELRMTRRWRRRSCE